MSITGNLITFSTEPNSGYPRAIVTNDGTLLAVYCWTDGTTSKIVTKGSKDEGATWSDPVDVISWDAKKTSFLNNEDLLQKSTGEILCAYIQNLIDDQGNIWQINLNISQSTDGGQSWSHLGTAVSEAPSAEIKGEWEPFLREAPDGTIQVYYSHELNVSDQDIVFRTSGDGGKTWSDFTTVVGAGVVNRPGMPQVQNLDSGGMNLIMVYESNANGPMQVWAETSSDGGKTWGNPNVILDQSPGNAGEPGITSVPGFLVVSSGSDMNMKVITNTNSDGGGAWSQPITVIPGADYGGVTAVEGGVMVLGTLKGAVVMQKFVP